MIILSVDLVSDDNSQDNSVDICRDILEKNSVPYEIIVNNPGKGVSENFLGAMKRCKGDYIFTSDQDDIIRYS